MAAVDDLVSEHIDIWTTAIKRKSSAGRGSGKKIELYGVKKLRELILDLAVRGLLVPQDPYDEPASELLERISSEKDELVKAKTLKVQKPTFAVSNDEKPFNLPESWEWAFLPQICNYSPGRTPSTKNPSYWTDQSDGIHWVSISDLKHGKNISSTSKFVSQIAAEEIFKHPAVEAGTLLMSFKLTLGKISILSTAAYHNEAIIAVKPYRGINKKFIFLFLPNRALAGESKAAIMGKTLNSSSLAKVLIPTPPKQEQHRIVAKVDELMALCDQLEQQTETSITAHCVFRRS